MLLFLSKTSQGLITCWTANSKTEERIVRAARQRETKYKMKSIRGESRNKKGTGAREIKE